MLKDNEGFTESFKSRLKRPQRLFCRCADEARWRLPGASRWLPAHLSKRLWNCVCDLSGRPHRQQNRQRSRVVRATPQHPPALSEWVHICIIIRSSETLAMSSEITSSLPGSRRLLFIAFGLSWQQMERRRERWFFHASQRWRRSPL